jgi:GR25 family glycosyltransferase involved in LPS biosynthesis
MKLSYAILHVKKDILRESLYLKNIDYLNKFAINLNQDSYGIYTQEDLDAYYYLNLGLNIDKNTNFRYSEIGCWASHYSAWQKFLDSNFDYVLILEDDIDILPEFYENLIARINMLPEDWDMFSALVPEGNFSYFDLVNHDIGNSVISKTYQGNWLGAYVLNKSGAKKIIESFYNPITRAVDIHLFYSPGMLNSYSLMPNVNSYLEGVDLGTTIHNIPRVLYSEGD